MGGLGLWAPPLPHPLSLEEEDGDNDHAVALISPMECLEIDFDRLLSFWNVPDDVVESTHQDTVSDGQLLSASFAQAVEIAMKVYELTPAIVQCALTEDASVLSAEKAIALENLAHGVEQYSAGDFNAAVARLGIEALGKPESLVYSIMSVPNGTARALILGAHHSVQEDIAIIESCSRGLGNLVDRFEVSRSFKTMLQVVLVIQNVLSQQCSFALKTKCLPRLGHQKVGHNRGARPSVLELVGETLEATHVRRGTLRFWRMYAVGRCPIDDVQKKRTWCYLDDLVSSPWDAISLLRDCSTELCSPGLLSELASTAFQTRALFRQRVSSVTNGIRQHPESASSIWQEQLTESSIRLNAVPELCDEAQQRITRSAKRLAELFGVVLTNPERNLDEATQILKDLKAFGYALHEERSRIMRMKARIKKSRSLLDQRRRARTWALVDTSQLVLHHTLDVDLIRSMLSQFSGSASVGDAVHGGPEGIYHQDPVTGQWVTKTSSGGQTTVLENLMHGGPEAGYKRDPVTGRWTTGGVPKLEAPLPPAIMGIGHERGPEGVFTRDPVTGRWTSAKHWQ